MVLWEGQGLGRKPSPISHEVPGTHSQLEPSTHSQDQVRSHWLRIAPIMPSCFVSLKSHQTEDWGGEGTGYGEEGDCVLRHVPQWVPWPPALSPEAPLPWIWYLTPPTR